MLQVSGRRSQMFAGCTSQVTVTGRSHGSQSRVAGRKACTDSDNSFRDDDKDNKSINKSTEIHNNKSPRPGPAPVLTCIPPFSPRPGDVAAL